MSDLEVAFLKPEFAVYNTRAAPAAENVFVPWLWQEAAASRVWQAGQTF
jgi:hypothetical protein